MLSGPTITDLFTEDTSYESICSLLDEVRKVTKAELKEHSDSRITLELPEAFLAVEKDKHRFMLMSLLVIS